MIGQSSVAQTERGAHLSVPLTPKGVITESGVRTGFEDYSLRSSQTQTIMSVLREESIHLFFCHSSDTTSTPLCT